MNFDAKVRRQSREPEDLLHAHIGGVDICARAFLIAAKIHEEGRLAEIVDARYAGWDLPENKAMLATSSRSMQSLPEARRATSIPSHDQGGRSS
jgi:xylose isomerase